MVHRHVRDDDDIAPAYAGRLNMRPVPKNRMPDDEAPAAAVYRMIHDELLLDGSSRLNMATFVTTWMEPEADRLMAETFDKNMIDKDEYPQTAEIERRCVNIVADLFNAPAGGDAVGVSTIGSSEAVMLGGPGHEVAVASSARRPPASRPIDPTWCSAPTCRWCGRSSAGTGTSSRATCRSPTTATWSIPTTSWNGSTRTRSASSRSSAPPSRASSSRSARSTIASSPTTRRTGSTSRSTSTRPAVGSSPRSSTPTSSGTSACPR